jgi:hypothetical protein
MTRRSYAAISAGLVATLALCRCGSTAFYPSSLPTDGGGEASPGSSPDVVIIVPPDAGAAVDASEAGCSAPKALACSGTCVDPASLANCGTCGNACFGPEAGPGHAVCQPGGKCAVACDDDGGDGGDGGAAEILCSGACVSPDDVNHCGTCTNTCAPPPSGNGAPTCPGAQCVMTCASGFHPGGAGCNADCLANTDDPSADPCVVVDGLGKFVSPTGNDTTGDGTKEHPYGSIGHAMDTGSRVYACGTFTAEQLVVSGTTRDGTSVYGGFDCATWTYTSGTTTKLTPTAPGFALQVNGLTKGVTFEDFEFDAIAAPSSVATGAGASSLAVIVNASAGVVFRRVVIVAASGQTGGTGTTGTNSWTGTASTGSPASAGTGGPAISCSCGGTGGQGGGAGVLNVSTSQFTPGQDGQDGTPLGVADHGMGSATAATPCTPGNPAGTTGASGAAGLGGAGIGTIAFSSGWSNTAIGGSGGNGGFGQGGGGGGGHYYVSGGTVDGAGGGGGCGGCGGAFGTGGFAGGYSIALITIGASVTLDNSSLSAASGGTGGLGGGGVGGQAGGGPGAGAGAGSCTGGAGGQGGTGGAGGGGVGGNSIAVSYSGPAPTKIGTVNETVASSPALGGSPGGGVSTAASQGNPGVLEAEQSF